MSLDTVLHCGIDTVFSWMHTELQLFGCGWVLSLFSGASAFPFVSTVDLILTVLLH